MKIASPQEVIRIGQIEVRYLPGGTDVNAGGPPDLKRIGEIMQRHGLQAV